MSSLGNFNNRKHCIELSKIGSALVVVPKGAKNQPRKNHNHHETLPTRSFAWITLREGIRVGFHPTESGSTPNDGVNIRSTSKVKWNLKALENLVIRTIIYEAKMSFVIAADTINWDCKSLMLDELVNFPNRGKNKHSRYYPMIAKLRFEIF